MNLNEQYAGDARYAAVFSRLAGLSQHERDRIVENIDKVCFDTYNYDESTGTFCPLAIARNYHNHLISPTDGQVCALLACWFEPVNILKGTPGKFYTTNRREDLLALLAYLKQ